MAKKPPHPPREWQTLGVLAGLAVNKRRPFMGFERPPFNFPPEIAEAMTMANLPVARIAFKRGNQATLLDALYACLSKTAPITDPQREAGVSEEDVLLHVPRWALREAVVWIASTLPERVVSSGGSGRGRTARYMEQYKQDRIDLARVQAVAKARRRNPNLSWVSAYASAARALTGKPAAGTAAAMRKSCERFKGRVRENPLRYQTPPGPDHGERGLATLDGGLAERMTFMQDYLADLKATKDAERGRKTRT